MSEKRFPPPGNEVGYREAAAPAEVQPPHPATAPQRHVIATRPDDPDVALRKASIDENEIRRQEAHIAAHLAAQRRGAIIFLVVMVMYVLVRVVLWISRH